MVDLGGLVDISGTGDETAFTVEATVIVACEAHVVIGCLWGKKLRLAIMRRLRRSMLWDTIIPVASASIAMMMRSRGLIDRQDVQALVVTNVIEVRHDHCRRCSCGPEGSSAQTEQG